MIVYHGCSAWSLAIVNGLRAGSFVTTYRGQAENAAALRAREDRTTGVLLAVEVARSAVNWYGGSTEGTLKTHQSGVRVVRRSIPEDGRGDRPKEPNDRNGFSMKLADNNQF